MNTVACVLRGGGEYKPEHVVRLYEDVRRHHPAGAFVRFICLTDTPIRRYGIEEIPLLHNWPGWWAKMELFRPDIPGDLLYFDLDTLIVGPLADIARTDGPAIMRDVYRPNGLQSSMMALPESSRRAVWDAFTADPASHMQLLRDDQRFLEMCWSGPACVRLWQDVVPGQVVSYKRDCQRGVPAGARVVIFHGRPRPWETTMW